MFAKSILAGVVACSSLAACGLIKRQDRTFNFDFSDKIRGVNLGGWFVLEPWITPSFFDSQPDWVVDEYTLCQNLGTDACQAALDPHWDTWITEQDFINIKNVGMNFVRIPIGYWSVIGPSAGEPYTAGAYPYLGRALDWAEGQGIKVMIDLHGAPGSQNGFDNSGRKGSILFGQGDTIALARSAVQKLRDDFAAHPAVTTIEPVNEPMASVIGEPIVEQYYRDTWGDFSSTNLIMTFHDGFLGVNAWDNTFDAGMTGLMTDTHHYEVFDAGQLSLTPQGHNEAACSFGTQMAANRLWTISGEWSAAMTDCTKWLNGRGVGARYDGTYPGSAAIGSCDRKYQGSTADLSQDEKDNLRNFINAQLDAYEKAQGWIYWAWKTEGSPEWDMQQLLANNIFPNPVTGRNGYRCS